MSDVRDVIAATAREWGGGLNVDPVALALATAQQESGFRSDAVGDQGHSVGPFQENDQGAGYGKSFDERTDPVETTKRFLRRAFAAQQAGHTDPGEIAAAAQRPYDPVGYASSVDALYDRFHSDTVATVKNDTYIGGATNPHAAESSCQPGWVRVLGVCVPVSPGGAIAGAGASAGVDAGAAIGSGQDVGSSIGGAVTNAVNGALGPIGSAIGDVGGRALTGARQLVIAGVVIAAVAALAVAGTRRTLS